MEVPLKPTTKYNVSNIQYLENGLPDLDVDSKIVVRHLFKTTNSTFEEREAASATHCLHCSLRILGEKVCVPCSYDARNQLFFVYEIVCSLECAKAVVLDSKSSLKYSLFASYLKDVYDIDVQQISVASDKNVLARYGGVVTDDEYRRTCKSYKKVKNPFVPCSYKIESKEGVFNRMSEKNMHEIFEDFKRDVS